MSYVQDKYGIVVPTIKGYNPNFKDYQAEAKTRIYTTKTGKPMVKSEVDQCIKMYKKEFKVDATVIVIPDTLKTYTDSLEKDFKLAVRFGVARPNQITLMKI